MARGAEEPFLGTADALTLKRWRTEFRRKALNETLIAGLIGGEDAIITDVTDLQTGGDEVTYPLLANLIGGGVVGSTTLTGKEEDPTWYSDKLRIDQTRHGVYVGDKLSEQRNPGIMRDRANSLLSEWASTIIMDPAGFNHLCSYTPANTDVSDTVTASTRGHNTIVAASRILRPSTHANDTAVAGDSTAKLNYALIDKLIEKANTAGTGTTSRLRKPSGGRWKLFVHWSQLTDLYSDETFQAQHLAAVAGADKREGLFKETRLVYRDVEIIPSNYITPGVAANGTTVANVRRAVFCGAGAMSIAFGKGYSGGAWDWQEDSRDYNQRKFVEAGLIWGLKANIFGSVDFAKIVVPTYTVSA